MNKTKQPEVFISYSHQEDSLAVAGEVEKILQYYTYSFLGTGKFLAMKPIMNDEL